MKLNVTLDDVRAAEKAIRPYIEPSPLICSARLSEIMGCQVYLKLENMNPYGSFKIRGAIYKISQLSAAERKKGVITASAGNHAQGVAWASKKLGVTAEIVMPKSAALVKIQNTRALGANVILEGENFDEAWTVVQRLAAENGRVIVHAFQDAAIVAGQGTVGLEILEELADVDAVIASIGGGGLTAGIGTVFKALRPSAKVIGVQAVGANSMSQSIKAGHAVKLERVNTFADGIAVVAASEVMRKILAGCMDEVIEVDDEAIAAAVLTLMESAKTVAEGSGAAPLAALEKHAKKLAGKKVVLVVSGGNIDVNVLARIIDRGLIRAGRRVRVNVWLSDRPGSLARLTDLIAKQGANVIQAIHDRSEPSTTIDETEVELTLETRGPDHSKALMNALSKDVLRLELIH